MKQLFTMHSIEAETGISIDTLAPFCKIRTTTTDGSVVYGQLPPDTLRELAVNLFRIASEADAEAALYRELVQHAGISPEIAGAVIGSARSRRPA